MSVLPFERFTLYSRKSPSELSEVLKRHLSSSRFWLIRGPEEPFTGEVSAAGFRIQWAQRGAGPFAVIMGRFSSVTNGARIDVTQRLSWTILLFWIGWLLVLAAFAFGFPSNVEPDARLFYQSILSIMPVMGAYVFLRLFWDDARHTKHFLKLILDAEEDRVS